MCHEASGPARRQISAPGAATLTAAGGIAPKACRTAGIGGSTRSRCDAPTDFRRQALQGGNAVLGRRMGREQVIYPLARQRIDDEEMRGGWRAFGGRIGDGLRSGGNLDQ